MAPSIKRGKIRAQVFGDVSGVITSFATKTGETLGLIRNTTTAAANNNNNGGPGGGDGGGGGGGFPAPFNGNNGG